MNTLIVASALAIMSSMTLAAPFDYEIAIGSPELDASLDPLTSSMSFSKSAPSDGRVSLDDFTRGNPDYENTSFEHNHEVHPHGTSAPEVTSYDNWVLGNPDA